MLQIFFMLPSCFAPPAVPLTLPKAASGAPSETAKVVVSLDQAGGISILEKNIPEAEFETALRAALDQNATNTVHFRGDTSLDYGVFLKLISRARNAGASQFHLVHDPASNP